MLFRVIGVPSYPSRRIDCEGGEKLEFPYLGARGPVEGGRPPSCPCLKKFKGRDTNPLRDRLLETNRRGDTTYRNEGGPMRRKEETARSYRSSEEVTR